MKLNYLRRLGFFFVVHLILIGCGAAQVVVHKKIQEGAYPVAVAILPFTADTRVTEGRLAANILRRVFFAHFSYLGYSDMHLEEVDRRLQNSGYTDPVIFSNMDIAELRDLLGADAIIRGEIIDANNFTGGIYAETWINARLEMIDLRTGTPLWETTHEELNQSSIISPTVLNIIKQQVENSDPRVAYRKLAKEFSIRLVREIPDPAGTRSREINLPKIYEFRTNLKPGQNLIPGDILQVVLSGDPNMVASFDIGSWKTRISMREISSGLYRGEYKLSKNDYVESALVIGRLVDHLGLVSKKVFKGALVNVKSSPRVALRP